ncbi:MAG: hypothetical protein ACOX87_00005, partial [Chloroflexota bacterium]
MGRRSAAFFHSPLLLLTGLSLLLCVFSERPEAGSSLTPLQIASAIFQTPPVAHAAGLPEIVESALVSNGYLKGGADIYQDLVVYHEQGASGDFAVYAVDLNSRVPWALSPGQTENQMMPRVHGSDVVWIDWRVPSSIKPTLFRYTGGSDPEVAQVTNCKVPNAPAAVYSTFIAYQDRSTPAPYRIRLKELQSGQEILLGAQSPLGNQGFPSLADGVIAFHESTDINSTFTHVRVFSFFMEAGQLKAKELFNTGKFAGTTSQVNPQITGDVDNWTLVWHEIQSPDAGIWGYRSGGSQFPICIAPGDKGAPAIHGDLVAWQDKRSGSSYDIYGYDIARQVEFPICTATGDQSEPRIHGDRIVWLDKRSGVWDIYTATIGWPQPTATATPEPTSTATALPTSTPTCTATATSTNTPSATPTSTPTFTATATLTATASPTQTPTLTATASPTQTPTATATATASLDVAGPGWYEDSDPMIQYSDGWAEWAGDGPEGGAAHRSSTPGATARLRFHGSCITLVTMKGPAEGVAEVWLDDVQSPEIDLYRSDGVQWGERVLLNVPLGEHLIVVKVSDFRNANSAGHDVVIDGFEVGAAAATSTPTNTPLPTSTATTTPTATSTSTPTVTPTALPRVSGVVDLQARTNDGGATVAAGVYSSTTNSDGAYTLLLPPGTYSLTVTADGYL